MTILSLATVNTMQSAIGYVIRATECLSVLLNSMVCPGSVEGDTSSSRPSYSEYHLYFVTTDRHTRQPAISPRIKTVGVYIT